MPVPDHVLEVSRLAKSFGHRPVLAEVSFTVEPGSIVVVSGPNGAGKTTLLRCLAGLARFSGSVLVRGRPVRDPDVRSRVAYLPQRAELPGWATVGEVLEFSAQLRGADPAGTAVPAGFLPDLDAPVDTLSGGQRRRVALAAALAGEPELLLLDEPAANLDEAGTADLWLVLTGLRSRGRAVLVATPALGELDGLADRLLVLTDGRLSADHPLAVTSLAAPVMEEARA